MTKSMRQRFIFLLLSSYFPSLFLSSHQLFTLFAFVFYIVPFSNSHMPPVEQTNIMFSWLLWLAGAGQENNSSINNWLPRRVFHKTKIENSKLKTSLSETVVWQTFFHLQRSLWNINPGTSRSPFCMAYQVKMEFSHTVAWISLNI